MEPASPSPIRSSRSGRGAAGTGSGPIRSSCGEARCGRPPTADSRPRIISWSARRIGSRSARRARSRSSPTGSRSASSRGPCSPCSCCRCGPIAGRVVDRQGKPVANVEVFQTGRRTRADVDADRPDGRFSLGGFRQGPVFLFARGDGFRFHGQLIRDPSARSLSS